MAGTVAEAPPDVSLDDLLQIGSTAKRTERLVQRRMRLSYGRPSPPRGPRIVGGALSWERPSDPLGVTHYSIYADDDSAPARRVPAGQLKMSDPLTGKNFYVASLNSNNGYESTKVLFTSTSSVTLGTDYVYPATFSDPFTPNLNNGPIQQLTITSNFTVNAPTGTGTLLELIFIVPAAASWQITWDAVYLGASQYGIDSHPTLDTMSLFAFRMNSLGTWSFNRRPLTREPWQ